MDVIFGRMKKDRRLVVPGGDCMRRILSQRSSICGLEPSGIRAILEQFLASGTRRALLVRFLWQSDRQTEAEEAGSKHIAISMFIAQLLGRGVTMSTKLPPSQTVRQLSRRS